MGRDLLYIKSWLKNNPCICVCDEFVTCPRSMKPIYVCCVIECRCYIKTRRHQSEDKMKGGIAVTV